MHLRHLFPLVPALAALLYACDDHQETAQVGDVVLEGTVTDEAYVFFESALAQGAPQDDPTKAATLEMPAAGAVLPRDTMPTFSWKFGAGMTKRTPLPTEDEREVQFAFGQAFGPVKAARIDWSAPLRLLLSPVRSAHAHGDPYNGTGTFLVFSTDSAPQLVRVLTSNTTYTPSAEAWGKMTAAGKPITLKLVSAIFEQNRVAQDGGPYAGSSTTFTVAP